MKESIQEQKLQQKILEGTIEAFNQKGLKFTMDDLAGELKDKVPYALGIRNIVDKVEMKSKLEEFLATKQ